MKNLLTLILLHCITFISLAQAPQKFSYQSVIRNAGNQLMANQNVGIKISILQGSATGSAVYAEAHSPLTNANGLATLEIGGGAVLIGNFSNINWANGPNFVKTETDVNGGSNYTVTNTQQLLSVPYALFSNTVRSAVSESGDTLYIGSQAYVIPGISAANIGGSGQIGITAHSCGADSVHNPAKTYGSITDQQGNVYKTIVIGNQEWMAENLRTTIYRNGDEITNVTDNNQWTSLTTGAWCFSNNDSQYECPYGKLYNWYTVADPRNVCPIGWHVPTDVEWTILSGFSGGGGNIKSVGFQYWAEPNIDATNESGFSGLPSSCRNSSGNFCGIGFDCFWWSFTDNISNFAYCYYVNSNDSGSYPYYQSKQSGFSVRCLRD